MQKIIVKGLFIAGIALLTVPSTLLAQDKDPKNAKDKKEVQNIVITRTGNFDVKTVIEIDGDKVKVNGKDVKDLKDVNVHVSKFTDGNVYIRGAKGQNVWNHDFNADHMNLFREDSNIAMLGVNTDDHAKGAEVVAVTKEGAADKIGLKKGDIITKVGDKAIEDADNLTKSIRSHKPGDKVTISYLRDGKQQTASAELGKWKGMKSMPRIEMGQFDMMAPPEAPLTFGNGNSFYFGNRPRLGLSIQDTDDGKGVKVLEVDEESNAAKAGLKKDDVILSVDDKEIKGTDDISRIIRDNKEKFTFNFKIQRDGKSQNVEVKMPRKLKTTDL